MREVSKLAEVSGEVTAHQSLTDPLGIGGDQRGLPCAVISYSCAVDYSGICEK